LRLRKAQHSDEEAAQTIQNVKREVQSLRGEVQTLEQANASLGKRVIQISGRAERAELENQCMHAQLSRMESENERMRCKAAEIERIVDDNRVTFEQLEQYK
jgi:chromosome segregation ATPase